MKSVIIVDDSLTFRKIARERMQAAGFVVVAEAADGKEAVHLVKQLRPDLVLMDFKMPDTDGIIAAKEIMAEVPTPVVLLSAYVEEMGVFGSVDPRAIGILDVCSKPTGDGDSLEDQWRKILLTASAASTVPISKMRRSDKARNVENGKSGNSSREQNASQRVVVIGASTGGPSAVRHVLKALPKEFPFPLIVAVHHSQRLSYSMAKWFDDHCKLTVRDAIHGEKVAETVGEVLTVPPGCNLSVVKGAVRLSRPEGDDSLLPSVDELFESVAKEYGSDSIGIILTGMGSDGAIGLRMIRERGGRTIAQDEKTSVVFGMPGAAVDLGAVDQGTPLGRIPFEILQIVNANK